MKLVAAAKVRRAQSAVLSSRPFSETLASIIYNLFTKLKGVGVVDSPYFEQRDVKCVSLVIVSGNRGLCGAYNSKIIKMAEERIKYLEEAGVGCKLIFVGKKAAEYFKRRNEKDGKNYDISNVYEFGDTITAANAD